MDKKDSPLKLHCKLKFWFQHFVKGEDSFEDSLHPVATIETVEQFWAYYQHFHRPTQLEEGSYIYLFKDGIKPVWEDEHNKHGGAFILRFERAKCDRIWQDFLLAYILGKQEIHESLNGLRIKIRKDFSEIDFWLKNVDDQSIQEKYRDWIVSTAGLDNDTPLEVIHFHTDEQ